VHDKWEQTRLICYWMGNHKATKPENLFPLEIDTIRLKTLIDSGKAHFATVRKQTPEEQLIMKRLGRQ